METITYEKTEKIFKSLGKIKPLKECFSYDIALYEYVAEETSGEEIMKTEKKELLIDHLGRCPFCYKEYLKLSKIINEPVTEKDKEMVEKALKKIENKSKKSIWETMLPQLEKTKEFVEEKVLDAVEKIHQEGMEIGRRAKEEVVKIIKNQFPPERITVGFAPKTSGINHLTAKVGDVGLFEIFPVGNGWDLQLTSRKKIKSDTMVLIIDDNDDIWLEKHPMFSGSKWIVSGQWELDGSPIDRLNQKGHEVRVIYSAPPISIKKS